MENDIHSWRGKPLNFVFIDEINNTPSIEELEAAAKAIEDERHKIETLPHLFEKLVEKQFWRRRLGYLLWKNQS